MRINNKIGLRVEIYLSFPDHGREVTIRARHILVLLFLWILFCGHVTHAYGQNSKVQRDTMEPDSLVPPRATTVTSFLPILPEARYTMHIHTHYMHCISESSQQMLSGHHQCWLKHESVGPQSLGSFCRISHLSHIIVLHDGKEQSHVQERQVPHSEAQK